MGDAGSILDPHSVSDEVCALFAVLAVDGCILRKDMNWEWVIDLIDLQVLEPNTVPGVVRWTAVTEFVEMLPPYTTLISHYKQLREYMRKSPTQDGMNLLREYSRQIGKPLAVSWKRFLLRREKDPDAKPFEDYFR